MWGSGESWGTLEAGGERRNTGSRGALGNSGVRGGWARGREKEKHSETQETGGGKTQEEIEPKLLRAISLSYQVTNILNHFE